MATFESYKQYWTFAHFVKRTARHVMDQENLRFLDAVIKTSASRVLPFAQGTTVWRAQLGSETEPTLDCEGNEIDSYDVERPHSPGRMVPLADRATEGRVNPKGIPCFYCSTDMETAMAETRPWIGSAVSVGQFVTLKPLQIVDCAADGSERSYFERMVDKDPERLELDIWGDINRAFSEPVTRNDDVAEYAPTQVLAEVFRNAGFDGVMYGSKLGIGQTIAIFDLKAARQIDCHLYRVKSVTLDYSIAAKPYYVSNFEDETGMTQVVVPAGEPASLGDS